MKKNVFKLLMILGTAQMLCASGYVGDLPNLSPQKKLEQNIQKFEVPKIKPLAPRKHPSIYANVILKNGSYAKYIEELESFIPILTKLKPMIEEKEVSQLFFANCNIFNLYVKQLTNTYNNKEERHYKSYQKLVNLDKEIIEITTFLKKDRKFKTLLSENQDINKLEREITYQRLDSTGNLLNEVLELIIDKSAINDL